MTLREWSERAWLTLKNTPCSCSYKLEKTEKGNSRVLTVCARCKRIQEFAGVNP